MPTYMCQEKQHNKVWKYEVDGLTVNITYGRVGSTMQNQSKSFGSEAARDAFIAKKVKEKTGGKKGYTLVTEEKAKQEAKTAQQLGIQYKISRLLFVNQKGNKLQQISNYDPKKYVYVEILNSWKKDITRMLLSKDESYLLTGGVTEANRTIQYGTRTPTSGNFVVAVRGVLRRLSEQLVEVIKTVTFAAVGARKLFDDDGSEEASQDFATLLSNVDHAGIDDAVVCKFASMGARVLEL